MPAEKQKRAPEFCRKEHRTVYNLQHAHTVKPEVIAANLAFITELEGTPSLIRSREEVIAQAAEKFEQFASTLESQEVQARYDRIATLVALEEPYAGYKTVSGTCLNCENEFSREVEKRQKRHLAFCSDECKKLYNLAHAHPNDTAAKAEYVVLTHTLCVEPDSEAPVLQKTETKPSPASIPKSRNSYVSKKRQERLDFEAREKKRHAKMLDFRCPKPYKQMFRSTEEAQAFIDAIHPDEVGMRPYPCQCGSIHIGHDKRSPKVYLTQEEERTQPFRAWCAYPTLDGYPDWETAEDYMYANIEAEIVDAGVSVKECSCGEYHVKFSWSAREVQRRLFAAQRNAR
jgi:hypothetical protein